MRADAFRAVRAMHCAIPVADIHADAVAGEHPVDQLIFGEAFDVLDSGGDKVWRQARAKRVKDAHGGWRASRREDALAVQGTRSVENRGAARASSGPQQALQKATARVQREGPRMTSVTSGPFGLGPRKASTMSAQRPRMRARMAGRVARVPAKGAWASCVCLIQQSYNAGEGQEYAWLLYNTDAGDERTGMILTTAR